MTIESGPWKKQNAAGGSVGSPSKAITEQKVLQRVTDYIRKESFVHGSMALKYTFIGDDGKKKRIFLTLSIGDDDQKESANENRKPQH